jgi:pentatricopeptide repeat protein
MGQVLDSSAESPSLDDRDDDDDDDNNHIKPVEISVYNPKEILETLGSYSSTIQISRRKQQRQQEKNVSSTTTKGANSLARYLQENPILVLDDADTLLQDFKEAIEKVMIQALRKAGESNDYKLITKLITSSIIFANDLPILSSRIFGEAINALSQTSSNINKIKSIWNLMATTTTTIGDTQQRQQQQQRQRRPSYLSNPPTAYELNILLKAMASRNKSKGCVDMFLEHAVLQTKSKNQSTVASSTSASIPIYIEPDAYTISTLFSILRDSITADQKLCDPVDFSSPSIHDTAQSTGSSSSSNLYNKLASLTCSTCWQWNSAIEILGAVHNRNKNKNHGGESFWEDQTNNHVYSSLLNLQISAQQYFVNHKNGHRLTMAILDDMIKNDIYPDIVTCTAAIQAMGQARVEESFQHGEDKPINLAVNFLQNMKSNSKLPNPNQYSYSAAITACAKQNDHETALSLLEEMRDCRLNSEVSHNDDSIPSQQSVSPNTWVYNAALLALDEHSFHLPITWSSRKEIAHKEKMLDQARQRTGIALSMLEQMKNDHNQFGMDTKPDTVTYNTILSIGEFSNSSVKPLIIIDEMKQEGVPRDDITYRNAITAATDSTEVISILHEFLDDNHLIRELNKSPRGKSIVSVFNTGLNVLARMRDILSLKDSLVLMAEHNIPLDDESVSALTDAVGETHQTSALKSLLSILENEGVEQSEVAHDDVSVLLNYLDSVPILPSISGRHYTQAIELCLGQSDFATAYFLLSQMRSHNFKPSNECMETFAVAYAKSATISAADRTDVNSTSYARAESAFKIAMALTSPNLSTMGTVARACAVTGQWDITQTLLRKIHRSILSISTEGQSVSNRDLDNIRRTHSFLLHECAKEGNLRYALMLTKDIQNFSKTFFMSEQSEKDEAPALGLAEISLEVDDMFSGLRGLSEAPALKTRVGMHPGDWISLIKAASKSGEWQICFNALQYLRIYVVRTKSTSDDMNLTNDRYEQLMPALTAAVRCLESHSQHAWAERCIIDWIEWSGRKPRAEAVLSAIRSLSSKGYGDEVKKLVDECLREDLGSCVTKKGVGYEEMLFIGAVTSLHNNGLYDDADEVFMSAISAGYLPFDFVEKDEESMLDLHGLNVALAHSAVRVAMRQHAARFEATAETPDMIIVTGKGENSAIHLRPVLRPEAQRMLLEEFYPPLNSLTVTGNIGALKVLGEDIESWQKHQQEQKGARMLELAALLRNLSCQERLRRTIEMSIKAIECDDTENSN